MTVASAPSRRDATLRHDRRYEAISYRGRYEPTRSSSSQISFGNNDDPNPGLSSTRAPALAADASGAHVANSAFAGATFCRPSRPRGCRGSAASVLATGAGTGARGDTTQPRPLNTNFGNCRVVALPYNALEVSYERRTMCLRSRSDRSRERQIQMQSLPRRNHAVPDVRTRSRGGR